MPVIAVSTCSWQIFFDCPCTGTVFFAGSASNSYSVSGMKARFYEAG